MAPPLSQPRYETTHRPLAVYLPQRNRPGPIRGLRHPGKRRQRPGKDRKHIGIGQEAQRKCKVELDKEVQAASQTLGWTPQDKSKFFMGLIESPKFAAFENQKRPLLQEVMDLMNTAIKKGSPPDAKATCEAAVRMQSIVEKVKEVNSRQYDFMSSEINHAAAAQ